MLHNHRIFVLRAVTYSIARVLEDAMRPMKPIIHTCSAGWQRLARPEMASIVQRRLHLNLVHDIGEQNPHASHKNGPENCRFLSDMSGSSLEVHLRVMLDCIVVGHLLTISNETADCQLIFFLRNSCSVTCYKIIKVCTRVHSL